MNIPFSSTDLLQGLSCLSLFIIATIFLFKFLLPKLKSPEKVSQSSKGLFGFYNTFLSLGFLVSTGAVLMVMNWTSYDYEPIPTILGNYEHEEELPEIIRSIKIQKPKKMLNKKNIVLVDEVPEIIQEEIIKEPELVPVTVTQPNQKPGKGIPKPPVPKKIKKTIVVKEPILDEDEDETPIFVSEIMPLFPCKEATKSKVERNDCSNKALLEYIYSMVNYPAIARENNAEGTAVVQFVIEPDGTVSRLKLLRDPGYSLGKEALRVANKMKDEITWSPGYQNGKAVAVYFNLPIRFKLEH